MDATAAPQRWACQFAGPAKVVMVMYRTAWNCSAMLAGAAGVWASVATWSVAGAVGLFFFAAATAVGSRLLISKEGEPLPWRQAARTGVSAGVVFVGAAGLVAWSGPPGLIVVALLTLGSPTVLTTVAKRSRRGLRSQRIATAQERDRTDRRGLARADVNEHRPNPTVVTESSLLKAPWMKQPTTSMDDSTLCFAWRVSFAALQQPLQQFCRMQIVDRRQDFLDELERRNPRGFQAWLASGARAAGDPTRYIIPAQHEVHRHEQR